MSDVLIVDDEASLRRLMRRCLERTGVSIVEAESAEEALRLVEHDIPKVAFCDAELQPGRPNGFWLAAELNRLYPHTVVVMVTSKDRVDAVVTGVRAGARVYMVKPVTPDQVLETLNASMDEHATRVGYGVSTRREPLAE
jgi:DNA-binding NtrC family response regulator